MAVSMAALAQFAATSNERLVPALKNLKASGESDGGKIKITLGGDYEVREVKIAPDVVAKFKVDQIGQLFITAYTRAKGNYESEVYKVISRLAKEQGIDFGSLA